MYIKYYRNSFFTETNCWLLQKKPCLLKILQYMKTVGANFSKNQNYLFRTH